VGPGTNPGDASRNEVCGTLAPLEVGCERSY